jgi:hypothetical protein
VNLLLSFAPFIAFVALEHLFHLLPALLAAAAIAAILVLRDALSPKRTVKLLEVATVALFGGLAAWVAASGDQWSVMGVRLRVDAGLLAIVLLSMALRRPFTLAYAKEQAPREVWSRPGFLRMNFVLTAAWALAFAAMVAVDAVMLLVPSVPTRTGIVITVLALLAAYRFSDWYPSRVAARRRAAEAVEH